MSLETSNIDRNTTLCLACSSSLPPGNSLFLTPCCNRPICPKCLSSNPRLARYDPCLACLGGVGVVGLSKGKSRLSDQGIHPNLDGAVRDEDTFVLGDDDEDDNTTENSSTQLPPPPPYSSTLEPVDPETGPSKFRAGEQSAATALPPSIPKYTIKHGDTLQGIALRFKVDVCKSSMSRSHLLTINMQGHELCRLNKLPPSTLSTTPHILFTRTELILPPSTQGKHNNEPRTEEDIRWEATRARERAEKRLQTLTKEVDWRVAKAYVALADDPDKVMHRGSKHKEHGFSTSSKVGQSSLEGLAVDQYQDDNEWEESQRRAGKSVEIPRFPYFNTRAGDKTESGEGKSWHNAERKWWQK